MYPAILLEERTLQRHVGFFLGFDVGYTASVYLPYCQGRMWIAQLTELISFLILTM